MMMTISGISRDIYSDMLVLNPKIIIYMINYIIFCRRTRLQFSLHKDWCQCLLKREDATFLNKKVPSCGTTNIDIFPIKFLKLKNVFKYSENAHTKFNKCIFNIYFNKWKVYHVHINQFYTSGVKPYKIISKEHFHIIF